VAIITLPVAVLCAFVVMRLQGINANIMSLGGIAIAIGAMVDAAIIMIENAHKHIERDAGKKPHWRIIADASKEVGPALFYSLLVITVSFVPVFTLEAQEGRLFKPLAFTKTYAMAAAALLSVTLVPVLMGLWIRGRILPEERNPINRLLIRLYHPVLEFVLRFKWPALTMAVLTVALTVVPFSRLGSEFMPPLWEGDLLYMPTMLPSVSITKAREILQQTDKIIKQFPEVHHVFGKIGRAETATDPAPLSMVETTIMLKPESEWPEGMTVERLTDAMNAAIQVPGLTNAWTMPIKTRIDMLSTGIKTPVGIKVAGPNLRELERLGKEIEALIRNVPGTLSVYAERVMGGDYLDFEINRDAIARYERELRDSLPRLREVLVPTPAGPQIPLGQLADFRYVVGPPEIKSENARPNAWIYVDIRNTDIGSYVERARRAVEQNVTIPAGYTVGWSGQYEYMQRAQARLMYVVPLTILIIFVIIYVNTGSLIKTAIVFLAVPFSLVGAIWLLYVLGYNMSIAVWVGLIALAGLDAETGVVMLLYLDVAYEDFQKRDMLRTRNDLADAIYHGAVKRVRPKVMTISVIVAGLLPIMWSHGTGADVMKRIAAPMVGGVVTSGVMELAIYPIIFYLWKARGIPKGEKFRGFHHHKEIA
jgi:Cu(I)/Ag(I) efflux system membrane protein CusA/SilA